MTSPLRGPQAQKEAASPPLIFRHAAHATGAAPPASTVLRIPLRGTRLRRAVDPGDRCGPWEQEERAGPGLPPRCARRAKPGRWRATRANRTPGHR